MVHSRLPADLPGSGTRSIFLPRANFFAEESENFAAGVPGANDRVRMCGYSSACGT
jgi:hypothetical protein